MALADRAGVVHADLHSGRDPRLINDHKRWMRGLGGSVLAVRRGCCRHVDPSVPSPTLGNTA